MADFDDMLLFAKLVDLKSFTAVAEATRLSRSLVSKRITQLEHRLGVPLVNRTTRRVDLTDAGKTLYRYCKQIEQTWHEAEAELAEIRRAPRGLLRINAPVTFGQLALPEAIVAFVSEYPDVRVELSLADQYVDLIEGGYDLAVRIGDLPDSTLKARKVGATRLQVFAHRDYLEKHGTPLKPQDLRRHNCLVYHHMRGGPNEWRFEGPSGSETVTVSGNFSAANGVPLYRAVKAGLGIALQPLFVLDEARDPDIVHLLEEYCRREIGIYVVYPTGRKPPVNTRAFIDVLARVLSHKKGTGDAAPPA